jgi:hypothetical protein
MRQWFEEYGLGIGEVPTLETATGKLAWMYYGWQWAVSPYVPAPEHEALPLATPNSDKCTFSITWSAGGHVDTRTFKGTINPIH